MTHAFFAQLLSTNYGYIKREELYCFDCHIGYIHFGDY